MKTSTGRDQDKAEGDPPSPHLPPGKQVFILIRTDTFRRRPEKNRGVLICYRFLFNHKRAGQTGQSFQMESFITQLNV